MATLPAAGCLLAAAQAPLLSDDKEGADLGGLDLEALSRIRITSVSKQPEEVRSVAAAVHVITGEDLRRSGAPSIPEALRLAPGTEVAAINAQRHAISIRGFNSEFANKLLVLMDGRSLYTPQFSGTYWDVQDTLLEDVERIEVVRGPGGTTWGVNAVNGVINIITRSARDTQGLLLSAGGGTEERAFGAVRYGGQLGDQAWYRVYTKAFDRDETVSAAGDGLGDDWYQSRTGFRVDSLAGEANEFTLQGDYYTGELTQYASGSLDHFKAWGANVVGRWTHTFAEESDLVVQAYYDATRRDSVQATSDADTFDVEARHRFALGGWNRFHWGVHYRLQGTEAVGNSRHYYDPEQRTLNLFGLFIEDAAELVPDRLVLSVGSKFEHNEFTGWEVLPNARLSWTPTGRITGWAAVSRGLTIPSLSDSDLHINTTLPDGTTLRRPPNPDLVSEELLAGEAGFRFRPIDAVSLDLAIFYNDYSHLQSAESTFRTPPPTMEFMVMNQGAGDAYGGEISVLWQPLDELRLRVNYSLLELNLQADPGSTDTTWPRLEGSSPQQQLGAWVSANPARTVQLDGVLRFVDELPGLNISAYWSLDARVAWRPAPSLELSVVGRNLLDAQHPEWSRSPGFPATSEIQRGVFARVEWTY